MSDNITPITVAAKPKSLRGRKETAELLLFSVQKRLHVTFCTLECASAGLDKAENEQDQDLWVRSARVVQRCVEELHEIRDDLDSVNIRRES
jgi:hypothetical protein